jgi:4-alpha-glucanotransferase
MTFKRSSGILLHPTSLPGPYGIGDIGPQAYRFIDWLSSARCRLWQVLPLGPTGYGDSPYQCFSAFAGNPYLISPEALVEDGFLTQDDLADKPDFPASRVDFGLLIPWKLSLLQKAFARFQSNPSTSVSTTFRQAQRSGSAQRLGMGSESLRQAFDYFCAEQAAWLDDFSLFMALKEFYGGGAWSGWPEPVQRRDKSALEKARKELSHSIIRYSFYQFLFFRQWNHLRTYAKDRGIQIIGDLPIFVAYDSVDVWSHPELFYLDEQGNPTVVAGVPPDNFSVTGQLWGNPLYNWGVHKQEGYKWWLARVRAALQSVDILRVDHFRGFAGYYEIPAGDKTAENGHWVPGPGQDFFRAVDNNLGDGLITPGTGLPIIAEDLGLITPDVIELLETFNLPGMKVLQFGFTSPDNSFLPHNYESNCVAYTGTHDNNTALGWLANADKNERKFALHYLRSNGREFSWDLIRAVWSSVAVMSITPMQDVLSLGEEARMNYPSRLGGNWVWRMEEGHLSNTLAEKLKELNFLYSR